MYLKALLAIRVRVWSGPQMERRAWHYIHTFQILALDSVRSPRAEGRER